MFTGIVTDVGTVVSAEPLAAGRRLRIATRYDTASIALGASIACGGPCLTVVAKGSSDEAGGPTGWFEVEASTETLDRTTLGAWTIGTRINLERALRVGDELGGHYVTGHVDGVAEIAARDEEGDMARFAVRPPRDLLPYIAEKGSVALDGVSLTVNAVGASTFELMLIPHTLAATNWGERQVGDRLNLEIDLLARYLARFGAAIASHGSVR